jgi:flagellar motor switch protein FliG
MSLGGERAAALTQRLQPEEVELISFEIARMDHVDASTTATVLTEWIETFRAVDSLAEGGTEFAREVLERAFGPQRALVLMRRIQGQLADVAGMDRLRNVDPIQLGVTIRGEHPQTIALILAHLEPQHTAAILRDIEPATGAEVIYRMACMEKVSPDMLRLIESALGNETTLSMSEGMRASGGPGAVAAVLNLLNASLERELLDGLAERSVELCDQVKNLMFVFEDIATLEDRSLQRILRDVEVRELALALKVASEGLKSRMMEAMTQRALGALQDEMEVLGPVRVRDVEASQAKIVALVRRLEESGEIVISGGGDDVVIA